MDYARIFSGLDDATVTDQLPKYTDGDFSLQVEVIKFVDGQNGLSFVVESMIQTSTNPEFEAGTRASFTINNLGSDSKTKKAQALGKLKGFLAACLHLDPDSPQSWVGLATMCCEHQLLSATDDHAGALYQDTAQTQLTKPDPKQNNAQFKYISHSYREHSENTRTLAHIVAEMQARQAG